MGSSRVQVKCPSCSKVFLPSVEETQSRAGASARRKGSSFERKLAKLFQDWWIIAGKKYEFRRTPMSGGSVLKDGWGMAGDICSTSTDFAFHIEAKNAPGIFKGWHQVFSAEKFVVWDWLDQANNDCQEYKVPLLIINRFDQPTYCVVGPYNRLCSHFISELGKNNIDYILYHSRDKNKMMVVWLLKDLLTSLATNWILKFKQCSQCNRVLPVSKSFFTQQSTGKFGLNAQCKDCVSVWRVENRAILRERQLSWRHQNPDKVKDIDNRQAKQRCEYRHRPWIRTRRSEYDKARRLDPRAMEAKRITNKRLYDNNVNYRIRGSVSHRINNAIRGKYASLHTLALLGCDIDTYKQYLELKFHPGMSWDNYGYKGWHIDHIIPCDKFDLSNIDEQRKCFNYTNTQPLWWQDNLSKGNK